MALRPGRTIRQVERPYTRVSYKAPRKSYVKGAPQPKLGLFEMGDPSRSYEVVLHLVAKRSVQIRHNALEAARISANHWLEGKLGKEYFLKVLAYPHHVLREKPIAMGAGADRYSQGMRLAFGKPVGLAVQTREGQRLMSVWVKREHMEVAKEALKLASHKLPTPTAVQLEEI